MKGDDKHVLFDLEEKEKNDRVCLFLFPVVIYLLC